MEVPHMDNPVNRRSFLVGVGGAAAGAVLTGPVVASPATAPAAGAATEPRGSGGLPAPRQIERVELERPVTCIIIGHGGRGSLCAGMSRGMPREWKVVG